MTRTLFIDDLRTPVLDLGELTIARTSAQAIIALSENEYDYVFFDHDLGGDDTIRPVILWLEEQAHTRARVPIAQCYIHTSNPVGGKWVQDGLRGIGYHVARINDKELL